MNSGIQDVQMSVDAGLSPQTRSINRSPEAALRGNDIPSPLAGEGQGEGETIRPSFLASRRFAQGKPGIDALRYVSGFKTFHLSHFTFNLLKD